MSIKKDLEKVLAAAQSAQSAYSEFAGSIQDTEAKEMFQHMSEEMDKHISKLQARLETTADKEVSRSELPPY